MIYIDEMIGQEVEMDEFSQMEATEEIAMKIEEKTLDMMEKDLESMEKFPNPTYAVLRLSYLIYLKELENLGYESKYQILNAMDFGIPQKRERNICFQYLFAKMIQDNWNK